MDKKILISIAAIGVSALVLGAGTYAYLHDREVSLDNLFVAGILDYKPVSVSGTYVFENHINWSDIKQDDDMGEHDFFTLLELNSNIADHAEVQIEAYDFYDWPGESGGTNTLDDFTKQFLVTEWRVVAGASVYNLLNTVVDDTLDGEVGYPSLYDVLHSGDAPGIYRNLGGPGVPTVAVGLDLSFGNPLIPDEANGNNYQGDSFKLRITIALCQAPGQTVLPLP
jgi:predicted ribosomally synthesized peptide with SipW-like signal peptide